jgi:hypothetical protein
LRHQCKGNICGHSITWLYSSHFERNKSGEKRFQNCIECCRLTKMNSNFNSQEEYLVC